MKIFYMSILCLLMWTMLSHAQAPTIQWQRSLGGTQNESLSNSLQKPTSDGGSIHIGSSNSNDGDVTGHHGTITKSDIWIVKLDSAGYIDWEQSYGGDSADDGSDILATIDGGYIFCGSTKSIAGDVSGNNGKYDIWMVKIDNAGAIQWQHCYGSPFNEMASSILHAADGGYVVLGTTDGLGGDVTTNHGTIDIWLFKIDSAGILLWDKSLGGSKLDYGSRNAFLNADDEGYYISGKTYSNDGDVSFNHDSSYTDIWFVKTDSIGNIEWEKTYGGSKFDFAGSIIKTVDGGFLLAGGTDSPVSGDVTVRYGNPATNGDCWVVKTDSVGNLQWVKTYGGSATGEQFLTSFQMPDGGYLLGGLTLSNDSDITFNNGISDSWLVRTDSTGTLQWQKCFGGSATEFINDMFFATDGSLLLCSQSSSNDGDVTGHHGTTPSDLWIVKLNPLVSEIESAANNLKSFSVYPNPASSTATILFYLEKNEKLNVKIYDIEGRCIKTLIDKYAEAGLNKITWDVKNENDNAIKCGIYIVNINSENTSLSKKLTIIK